MLTMRRFAIATLAGLALLAGQAAAANQGPDLRVGDRVGPTKGSTKNFQNARDYPWMSNPLILGGIVAAAIAVPILIYRSKKDASP